MRGSVGENAKSEYSKCKSALLRKRVAEPDSENRWPEQNEDERRSCENERDVTNCLRENASERSRVSLRVHAADRGERCANDASGNNEQANDGIERSRVVTDGSEAHERAKQKTIEVDKNRADNVRYRHPPAKGKEWPQHRPVFRQAPSKVGQCALHGCNGNETYDHPRTEEHQHDRWKRVTGTRRSGGYDEGGYAGRDPYGIAQVEAVGALQDSAKAHEQQRRRNHQSENTEHRQRFSLHRIRDDEDLVDQNWCCKHEQCSSNEAENDLAQHRPHNEARHFPVVIRKPLGNMLCRRQAESETEETGVLQQGERQPEQSEACLSEIAHDVRYDRNTHHQRHSEPGEIQHGVPGNRPSRCQRHHCSAGSMAGAFSVRDVRARSSCFSAAARTSSRVG